MDLIKRLIHNIKHKVSHLKFDSLKLFLKRYGMPFVVIFIVWEIIEDIMFPILFYYLGENVNAAFYSGIPASLLLCLHPIAVPIIWGVYCFATRKKYEKPELH